MLALLTYAGLPKTRQLSRNWRRNAATNFRTAVQSTETNII